MVDSRVLDTRLVGDEFEPHWRHCNSVAANINFLAYSILRYVCIIEIYFTLKTLSHSHTVNHANSKNCMANSVDPDQPASLDLDPHCLHGNLKEGSGRKTIFFDTQFVQNGY